MQINADNILTYVLVAFGGFFVKYVWDSLIKAKQEKLDKAQKYDQQALKKTVEDIMNNSLVHFKSNLEESLNQFKGESKSTFEYWQKMYWEAVGHLEDVEKDFNKLRDQDLLFYKYQLINTCKKYISQGWMAQYQFDRLTELHKIYNNLGGNSQGDMYYEKAISLPIRNESRHKDINDADDEIYVDAEDLVDLHKKGED